MLRQEHRTIALDDGESFYGWAAERWPAPTMVCRVGSVATRPGMAGEREAERGRARGPRLALVAASKEPNPLTGLGRRSKREEHREHCADRDEKPSGDRAEERGEPRSSQLVGKLRTCVRDEHG